MLFSWSTYSDTTDSVCRWLQTCLTSCRSLWWPATEQRTLYFTEPEKYINQTRVMLKQTVEDTKDQLGWVQMFIKSVLVSVSTIRWRHFTKTLTDGVFLPVVWKLLLWWGHRWSAPPSQGPSCGPSSSRTEASAGRETQTEREKEREVIISSPSNFPLTETTALKTLDQHDSKKDFSSDCNTPAFTLSLVVLVCECVERNEHYKSDEI